MKTFCRMSFANLRPYIYHKCTFKKTVSISCKTTSSTSTHIAKCHFLSQNLPLKKKWSAKSCHAWLGSPRRGETSDHGLHIQCTGLAKWHLNLSLQTAGVCCCWLSFFRWIWLGTKTIILQWHIIYIYIYCIRISGWNNWKLKLTTICVFLLAHLGE